MDSEDLEFDPPKNVKFYVTWGMVKAAWEFLKRAYWRLFNIN